VSGYLGVHRFEQANDGEWCGVPDPTLRVGICVRYADHPVHAVDRPEVDELVRALSAHPWRQAGDFPDLVDPSEHRRHHFNSDCAICVGDLHAIAAFILDRQGATP
jgi:hypothetical protein